MPGLIIDGTSGADTLTGSVDDDIINGLEGADNIFGGAGADLITGGLGNDTLRGESGADIYFYSSGDGNDTIVETGPDTAVDTLKLTNINEGGIRLTQSSYNLIVTIKATNETININGFFITPTAGVEQLEFGNGARWSHAILEDPQIIAATQMAGAPLLGTAAAETLNGTSQAEGLFGYDGDDTLNGQDGNDLLNGGAGNDSVNGGAGNDTLYGSYGDDLLNGGAGDDVIYGGTGSLPDYGVDTLIGGLGNDILRGEVGRDHYRYASGDGNDVIFETGPDTAADELKLIDINEDGIRLTRSSYDLVVTIKATNETITVNGYFISPTAGVEELEFGNGVLWDHAIIDDPQLLAATHMAGTPLLGSAAAETLTGTSQTEGLFGYAGDDTLNGLDGDDLLNGGTGNDIINGGNGADTLYGSDGTDTVDGGAGDDIIYGGTGSLPDYGGDLLIGGVGNDTLRGEVGGDTYRYSSGDGNDVIFETGADAAIDTLQLADIDQGGIRLTRSSYNLIVTDKATNETINVNGFFITSTSGVEQLEFGNGVIWSHAMIEDPQLIAATLMASGPVTGTASADTLTGTSQAEGLFGYAGDDILNALDGNDVLYASDGNDTLDGGAGADTLFAGLGADTLIGSMGADTLQGEGGSDTYLYAAGDGNDTIVEGNTTADTDKLILTNLNATDVSLSRVGNNLVIAVLATSETVTINSQFSSPGSYGIEALQFADNTVLARADFIF